jgi:hypothetical protein
MGMSAAIFNRSGPAFTAFGYTQETGNSTIIASVFCSRYTWESGRQPSAAPVEFAARNSGVEE